MTDQNQAGDGQHRSGFTTPDEFGDVINQLLGCGFNVLETSVDDEEGFIVLIGGNDESLPVEEDINAVCIGYYSPDSSGWQWVDAPFLVFVGDSRREVTHEHSTHEELEAALDTVRGIYGMNEDVSQ